MSDYLQHLERARSVIDIEIDGLNRLGESLGFKFYRSDSGCDEFSECLAW